MNNEVFKSLPDLQLFTLCIYGEARNQGLDGMLAVGSVVMNRVKRPSWWGNDIRQVILKHRQFSCFNEGDSNRDTIVTIAGDFDESLKTIGPLKRCFWIAKGILKGFLASNVGDANHYHNRMVNPSWKNSMRHVKTIGDHEFYHGK